LKKINDLTGKISFELIKGSSSKILVKHFLQDDEFNKHSLWKSFIESIYEIESLKHEKDTFFYISSGLEGDPSS